MDVLEVLSPVWDFLARYFSIEISLGGFSFTVGALTMWSILVVILIGFLKGWGR